MTDINALDPETRCLALVGKFLQKWATMEAAMRTVIETALELDDFQIGIIDRHTTLQYKINILRTLVSVLKNKQFDDTLNAIVLSSKKRNTIAHNGFAPSPDGNGVSFASAEIWDIPRFEAEYVDIQRLTAGVAAIADAINQKRVRDRIRRAARANPALFYTGVFTNSPTVSASELPNFTALRNEP